MSNEIIKKSVMVEAEGLVNGARAAAYGHPKENFERICLLWNAYLAGKYGEEPSTINEHDHAIMMILVKIARLQETPDHRDSLVDICGYAGTYEKLLQREQIEQAAREAAYEALADALEAEGQMEAAKPLRRRFRCCGHCFDNNGLQPCDTPNDHFIGCTRGCEC